MYMCIIENKCLGDTYQKKCTHTYKNLRKRKVFHNDWFKFFEIQHIN